MEKYTRVKLLGSGSYGTATLFTTKEGKRVVIKEIDIRSMPPSECKAAEQEAKVSCSVQPSGCLPLYPVALHSAQADWYNVPGVADVEPLQYRQLRGELPGSGKALYCYGLLFRR